jgi:predicted nucleic acid-binding protein
VLSGEPYEEKAVKVKSDQAEGISELCAPSFMIQEVTNAVWRALKLKRIIQETAKKALKSLDDLQINFIELNWSNASEELSIANKIDLTIYDSSYLYLSEKTKASVITADDKMYQKAKDHFRMLHLKDYI